MSRDQMQHYLLKRGLQSPTPTGVAVWSKGAGDWFMFPFKRGLLSQFTLYCQKMSCDRKQHYQNARSKAALSKDFMQSKAALSKDVMRSNAALLSKDVTR
jgi:hypothetical protein